MDVFKEHVNNVPQHPTAFNFFATSRWSSSYSTVSVLLVFSNSVTTLETTFLQQPVTQHQTKYIWDKHRFWEALTAF